LGVVGLCCLGQSIAPLYIESLNTFVRFGFLGYDFSIISLPSSMRTMSSSFSVNGKALSDMTNEEMKMKCLLYFLPLVIVGLLTSFALPIFI
jgi:hypothetical protein